MLINEITVRNGRNDNKRFAILDGMIVAMIVYGFIVCNLYINKTV